eukprot:CAMPEP_0179894406 /NCGR_PEP_ID=MMETSP0982-20121206/35269_1 /TAXON_ID=483367 /ORGANISM="non described non described, Strain CCMP 2436" /LENGTH=248 /DNA_ID=CAMNT_0021790995 /DNA_START=90 /DNA_END=836 /DNA_ORIENTATION=-
MTQVVLALALVVLVLTLTRGVSNAAAFERHEAILVLAGGVDKRGAPHCTVAARLRAAANASGAHGGSVPIVLNGGGTTWKPRHVDRNGFSIPEAALMAEQIGRESGILPAMLYPESFSDDTVGNAFFARTMHTDLRPEWRNLLVITSQFQIARTQAIYAWVFGLTPRPAGREYRLRFQAVPDDCLDPKVLALRQAKEAESLRKLEGGPLMHMQTLAEAHEFIWHRHGGYSVRGVLSKQPLDSKLADTY